MAGRRRWADDHTRAGRLHQTGIALSGKFEWTHEQIGAIITSRGGFYVAGHLEEWTRDQPDYLLAKYDPDEESEDERCKRDLWHSDDPDSDSSHSDSGNGSDYGGRWGDGDGESSDDDDDGDDGAAKSKAKVSIDDDGPDDQEDKLKAPTPMPVTHLITTVAHVDLKRRKVQWVRRWNSSLLGHDRQIAIVNFDWLIWSVFPDPDLFRRGPASNFPVIQSITTISNGKGNGKGNGKSKKSAIEQDAVEDPPAKKFEDAQKLHVPVSLRCPAPGLHRVYIDENGVIYDAGLSTLDAKEIPPVYRIIQVVISRTGYTYALVRHGLAGSWGDLSMRGDGTLDSAVHHFKVEFEEVTKKKWEDRDTVTRKKGIPFYVPRIYEEDPNEEEEEVSDSVTQQCSDSLESLLPESVQQMMKSIFNKQYFTETMKNLGYDVEKLPLDQLSKPTFLEGFENLKQLNTQVSSIASVTSRQSIEQHLKSAEKYREMFYNHIPHSLGSVKIPVINSRKILTGAKEACIQELRLMESLAKVDHLINIMKKDGFKTGKTMNDLDWQLSGLGVKDLTPLDSVSKEYKLLEKCLINSHSSTCDLTFRLQGICHVAWEGEAEHFYPPIEDMAFDSHNESDQRLLWHGSPCTEFGTIFSQGLSIPPDFLPTEDYAFGKGFYFTDSSSKAANDCHPQASGDTGLLLLCQVVLKEENGTPMLELVEKNFDAEHLMTAKGSIATWAKGQIGPAGWQDAVEFGVDFDNVMMPDTREKPGPTNYPNSHLQYNEYIVYNASQIKFRYLFLVEMKKSSEAKESTKRKRSV